MQPERILVIGCSGAGKSTFARHLALAAGLPLIHLDAAYWLPGWVEPHRETWRKRVAALVSGQSWVMDGNYSGTFDIRMPRATMIVFLDLPTFTCLRRVLWRPLRYWGQQRPDMAPGCIERYDWPFLTYVWRFRDMHRPKIIAAIQALGADAKLVHLRSRREMWGFLTDLQSAVSTKAD